ncbi:hypothetical protein B0H12DRAFT_1134204, partial [Mycena haematopus]
MLNRARAPVRYYASVASKSKKQKAAPQNPRPAAPEAPSGSLRNRIMMSHHRNWEKRQGQSQQQTTAQAAETTKLDESLSEEEKQMKMAELIETQREFMRSQGRTPPVITLPLLDHMIPYSVGFKARKEYPSLLDVYRQFQRNRINDGKNAFSMRHIAVADSFPGIEVDPKLGWFRSTWLYARRVFQAQSVKSDAWVAPMRQEILNQYIVLNETIMNGNTKRLEELTMPLTPLRILSLRAGDGDGSRVAVQALVRFDTEQSIEMYDKEGRALHTPAPSAAPPPAKRGKALHIVPAVPKRVTEYLVVDKAFYDPDGKWKF